MEATGKSALLVSRGPQYIGLRNTDLLLFTNDHRDWVLEINRTFYPVVL